MSAFITLPWLVRVTVGLTIEEESQQHIDAIQLTGSETLQQTDFSIAIDYNDLENKPTATDIVPPVSLAPVFTSLLQTVTNVPLLSTSNLLAVPPRINSTNITSLT
jgi:hypothetical protein